MKSKISLARVAITLVVVALAAIVGWYMWDYYMERPWTRDGRVRADVVQVAPDVSGMVASIAVRDNQHVRRGDVLFTIDQDRYRIAVAQAEAMVESRRADMAQHERDMERQQRLGSNVVSVSDRENAESAYAITQASHRQAQADLELAKLNLRRTEVRAVVDGYVTNLELHVGDYVQAGGAALAVVDSNSFHVVGYFEETKLPRIAPGARVAVALMGLGQTFEGHVDSIASGIVDRERSASPDLLANINPTFTWVRLAQRIPVRITLDNLPEGWQPRAGLTATVTVLTDPMTAEQAP
ncbi:secretion protein HylD [Skermanella stibiiresistens SB22]|uniref:Secretion protein HylD n=1 Tax=Skermanella stibiiresistens SB22 TaxID=1385369 RepID=W9HDF5_9PROT|nr:efflux RND transporter periplasmic adaptor subunit [Skermanella stibiiresistens]EWY41933.1 secretion protein HylD [Skermanella stibiiresistens SB22]